MQLQKHFKLLLGKPVMQMLVEVFRDTTKKPTSQENLLCLGHQPLHFTERTDLVGELREHYQ